MHPFEGVFRGWAGPCPLKGALSRGHGQLLDVDDIGDKQQIEGEEEDNSQSRLRNAKGRGRVRSMHRIFIPMTR